jgi:hypothetical protein
MYLTDQKRDEYADKVILFLNDKIALNCRIKRDDLFKQLEIPEDYRTPVFNKLCGRIQP